MIQNTVPQAGGGDARRGGRRGDPGGPRGYRLGPAGRGPRPPHPRDGPQEGGEGPAGRTPGRRVLLEPLHRRRQVRGRLHGLRLPVPRVDRVAAGSELRVRIVKPQPPTPSR
jgi:hypothetical protein